MQNDSNQDEVYENLKASRFKQQKLPAWRPVPTIMSTTITFVAFGVIFIVIGVVVLIYSGKVVEIEVPLGTYKLYYSGGDVWYGPFKRFLESGVYRKSEDLLEFYEDGNYACGVELELQVSVGGNMDSQDVPYSSFPD